MMITKRARQSTRLAVFFLILTISLVLFATAASVAAEDDEQVTVTSEADELRQNADHQRPPQHSDSREQSVTQEEVQSSIDKRDSLSGLSRFDRFFDDLWEEWPSPWSIMGDFDLDRDFGFFWPSRHRNFIFDSWPAVKRSWRRTKDGIMDRLSDNGRRVRCRQDADVPSFRARADLKQVGNTFELTIDVPGMDKEDIKIEIKEKVDPWSRATVDVLEVSGEHRKEIKKTVAEEGQEDAIGAPQEKGQIAPDGDTEAAAPAEKKKDASEGRYIWTERTVGQFQRSVTLPRRILKDKIRAKLDNGVLTVVMPIDRQEEEEPAVTRIAID